METMFGASAAARSEGGPLRLAGRREETQSGVSHPPTGLRQDITQIEGCERFRDRLLLRGHDVRYHLYEGGYELGPWEQELPDALPWLLGEPVSTA
jgi:hypothetical protein